MRAALALILWLAAPAWGAGSCMAIIGTGEVGGALGMRFAGLGHAIVYGSRTPQVDRVRELVARTGGDARALIPQDAAQACGILVLAIPWEAAESTVAGLGDLERRAAAVARPAGALRQGVQYRELSHHGESEGRRWPRQRSAVE